MPRPARYSSSRNTPRPAAAGMAAQPAASSPVSVATAVPAPFPTSSPPPPVPAASWWRVAFARLSPVGHPTRPLWWAVVALSALLLGNLVLTQRPGTRAVTQEDIDQAVQRTLETVTLPSPAARAVEAIGPSVVRVVGYASARQGQGASRDSKAAGGGKDPGRDNADVERGVGTGVVIVDKGVILTNLHVVMGADRITVTFADGAESAARITGAQPENDLAVLQALKVPDDLVAAPLKSTAGLRPGDQVAAVGFPFGIGPSASAGVVSGLGREFTSPEGKRQLSNLIQFDAAANPGNSGGPLVNMDGEVVGIVTAILNPTPARTFLGIGFAVPIENAASAVGMSPF